MRPLTLAGTLAIALVAIRSAPAEPQDQDFFTTFEGIDSEDFSVGNAAGMARFTGGFSGVAGILHLYHSGAYGWMVRPNETGTIAFTPNAAEVEFYARRHNPSSGTSVLTAYNDAGGVIATHTITQPSDWDLVKLTGSIDRIEFRNNDPVRMNSIDDFGFTASSTTPPTPGDADSDNDVDRDDLVLLMSSYGKTTDATFSEGDFSGDFKVGLADLRILNANFGFGTSLSLVPEPASKVWFGIALAALLFRRWRKG
jgi:hypothetical protein